MRNLTMPHATSADDAARFLRLIRFALCGAIVGTALVGVFAPAVGPAWITDLVGAGVGFAGVIAVKVTHLL